jgi:hypothetical protein
MMITIILLATQEVVTSVIKKDMVENSSKVKTKVSVMPENTEWETLID